MDTGIWLARIGLEQYAPAFSEHDIETDILPRLTSADLVELGVASLGHRRRILGAAQELATAGETWVERRQMVVLFCDLVGSSEIAETHDPEDVHDLLLEYHAICERVIAQNGGQIANFMGDGAVAAFGYPRAARDDAVRGIRAGRELLKAFRALRLPDGRTVQSRVGLDTGLVVVGGTGAEARLGNLSLFGETLNRASRIQTLAPPGAIWISDATRTLSRDTFGAVDAGQHVLRGFTRPVQLWGVTGRKVAPQRNTGQTGPMVGRKAQLAAVSHLWTAACRGQGGVAVLQGESGIGKTRFIEYAAAVLDPPPAVLHRFEALADQQATTYGVLLRFLETTAGIVANETIAATTAKLANILELPDPGDPNIGYLAGLIGGNPEAAATKVDPALFKQWLFDHLAAFLMAGTQQGPVLITIDDADLADPTSLDFFRKAIGIAGAEPQLLLASAREAEAVGLEGATGIALGPMDDGEIREILDQLLVRHNLPVETIAQIIRRSEGVPVFATEFAQLAQHGHGPEAGVELPATLQELLLARIDALGPVKELAWDAACIGRDFSAGLLAQITSADQASLAAGLRQMQASELVTHHGADSFAFRHGLIHKMAYDMQLRRARRVRHRRIAETLDRDPLLSETEATARQYQMADAPRQAAHKWQLVADRQIGMGGYAEALTALDGAQTCLAPLAADPDLGRLELRVLAARGSSLIALRPQAATDIRTTYEDAHRLSQTLEPTPESGPILFGLAVYFYFQGQLSRTAALCDQLISLERQLGRSAGAAGAHLMRTQVQFWRGSHAEVYDTMQSLAPDDPRRLQAIAPGETRQMARFAQVPSITARITYVWSLNLCARFAEADHELEGATRHAHQLRHPYSIAQSYQIAAWHHQTRQVPGACRRAAQALHDMAEIHQMHMFLDISKILLLWADGRDGADDAAADKIDAIAERLVKMGAHLAVGPTAALIADLALRQGSHDQGLRAIERALKASHSEETLYLAELYRLRGELRSAQDKSDPRARADMARAFETAKAQGARLLMLRAALSLERSANSGPERDAAMAEVDSLYHAMDPMPELPDWQAAHGLRQTFLSQHEIDNKGKRP